ncbi:hypothetical protein [Burkholderia ubonensis]|uniref:hypothetical protein n=1 Tax=Burkholderia ubonensis TaxID=101571 RepID=UPI0012FB08EE|nr:hypothetical protein [Burkholderia ubonensis]
MTGEPRKRPMPNYAVTNAREYNVTLKRRGQLSLYCPNGDLKALFINDTPDPASFSRTATHAAIRLAS